mgnify:FL=1
MVCKCGCGEATAIASKTDTSTKRIKGQPMMFVKGHNRRRPVEDRFWEKIVIKDTGCWEWQGYCNEEGYGRLGLGSTVVRAHRWAYEHYKGPIGDQLPLDHICRVRHCVNPDHLEPVTHRENAMRGEHPWVKISRSGFCKRGHLQNEENSYYPKGRPGSKQCRVCRRLVRPADLDAVYAKLMR